jgi:nicotinamidase-related amidase
MSKVLLTIIDPQWDFCHAGISNAQADELTDSIINPGSLFVPGANDDMSRLAKMISKAHKKIDDIAVTMDSHRPTHIAHSDFWRDDNGNQPSPFTVIDKDDVCGKNPKWHTYNPGDDKWGREYVTKLESRGRNKLCIWPKHCIIGSNGWQIAPVLQKALTEYCEKEWATIDYLIKGDDPFTEWYSAVMADVEIPKNPKTVLNTNFIQQYNNADLILIAGEALSHCVRFTFEDIFKTLGDKAIKKFMLLTDATSNVPVPCFIKDGEDFIKKYTAMGMQTCTCAEFADNV